MYSMVMRHRNAIGHVYATYLDITDILTNWSLHDFRGYGAMSFAGPVPIYWEVP
jgi:hypothetical protein